MSAPCPVCGATPSSQMAEHLRANHPTADWGEYGTPSPTANGQVRIGVPRRTAYALGTFPLDVVDRATIRAMLPDGKPKRYADPRYRTRRQRGDASSSQGSSTGIQFGKALKNYERLGYIQRGKRYLRILNRQALLDIALEGITTQRVEFLTIERAVKPVRQAIREAETQAMREQATRELQAVYDLMKSGVNQGLNRTGKGSVRHVPHGWRGRPS